MTSGTTTMIAEAELALGEAYYGVPLYAPDRLGVNPSDIARQLALLQAADIQKGSVTLDSPEVAQTSKHLQMLYNLESYIHDRELGMDQSQLHEHQQDVFHKIYEFLSDPFIDETDEVIRHGYIQMPTGTGKTAIFTTLVDALNKPVGTAEKIKSLVLVPKLDIVQQTTGTEEKGGFAKFAPDTSVTEYHGSKKDLSGDAVVMTYDSFRRAVEKGVITQEMFDLVICDEAHRLLGAQTKDALMQFAKNKIVIGLTATPDFSESHQLSEVLPVEIASMSLREAINEGFLAPIQCYAITSDVEIETIKKNSKDYIEAELAQLIDSEWRNHKGVEFAKTFVEQGKQGLISCVPGENLRHAREMAEKLTQTVIQDAETGEFRNIRAVAVDGKMNKKERAAIYAAYDAGEIDVLTYVDLLTEGWDSANAKFLINLRPTTSPVNALQRIGRILRPTDTNEIAIVVEIIDKSEKPQFTFFHAIGEEEIELGLVYGKPSEQETTEPGTKRERSTLELPPELLAEVQKIDHVQLRELLLAPNFPEAPEGYLSLHAFSYELGCTARMILSLLKEHEVSPSIFYYNSQEARYLDPDQQEFLRNLPIFHLLPKQPSEEYIGKFALQIDSSIPFVLKTLEDLGETYERRRNSQGKMVAVINDEQMERILAHENYRNRDMEGRAISRAAHDAGISANQFEKLASEIGITFSKILGRTGVKTLLVQEDQYQAVLKHPYFSVDRAEENGNMAVATLAQDLGERPGTVMELIKKMGLELTQARVKGAVRETLTPEQQELVRNHPYFQTPKPTESQISLQTAAKELGIGNFDTIKRIAAEVGVEVTECRGRNRGAYVEKADLEKLAAHEYFAYPPAETTDVPLHRIGKELQTTPEFLASLASEYGWNIQSKRGANSIVGLHVREEDIESIREVMTKVYPMTPPGYMGVRKFAGLNGTTMPTVLSICEELGITAIERRYGGKFTPTVSPEDMDAIKAVLASDRFAAAPQGYIGVSKMARQNGMNKANIILELCSELGIEPLQRRNSGQLTYVLSPEEQIKVQEALDSRRGK